MSSPHEPREAFVSTLEARLRDELAHRRLVPPAPAWLPRSTRGLALAAAAIVAASMAIGGGVVAAAYEIQQNAQRDALVATIEQRVELARRKQALVAQQLREVQNRVAVGLEHSTAVAEAQQKVTEAQADVELALLDLAEARASGREPVKTVSAPLVAGRDFVSDRWQVEASARQSALQLAKLEVDRARVRFDNGLANNSAVENAGNRLFEIEAGIQLAQQKLAIRRSFLRGELSAAVADLQVMLVELEQRRTVLARRIELSRRQMNDIRLRTEIGTSRPLELAEAEVRLQELQLSLAKTEYELALVRQKGK